MSVHYKFKSALDFDTVTFDGLHISVSDLKKAIIHQKRLGKTVDFDLQITNAQTKEEYTDDSSLIPKNTSLIIARIPLAIQPKKPWDPQADKNQGSIRSQPEPDSGALDLSQMNGTEEDKIQAMMIQSTLDYDPNKFKHSYQKIRGQGQTGEVPANYRCYKCHKPGHWIKNCPLGSGGESVDVKRNTGIPRSFIERDSQEKSGQQTPEQPPPVVEKKQEIPEDLICNICKNLFTDAVMIPCCGSSFCDECVRTALLESEDNECPDCKEKGSSPGSLIPNRFLRNSVNAFRNETGYNKPRQVEAPRKPKEIVPVEPTDADKAIAGPSGVVANVELKEKPNEPPEEEKPEKSSPKSKVAPEPIEKKLDPGTHSSHDEIESDFEDNITVTVPPAHLQSQRTGYRERHYNGRHSRHLKPPGMDGGSPKIDQMQNISPNEERPCTPTNDEKEISSHMPEHIPKHHPIMHQPHPREHLIRPHRSVPSDMYGPGPPTVTYAPTQNPMGPGRPYDMGGGYGIHPPTGYAPYMMGERMRGPFHPIRPGYPHMHQMRPRHMVPSGNLASVYQGVAAKVGTGIIDDPLEAFNRIMREKEKRKEERRRSPIDSRRRSRSIELNINRGRHSPAHHSRPPRMRTPDDRRLRSPPPHRERRERSRDGRSIDKDKRRHRSSSFSDRSSRSRSWSIPRKRTKSPMSRRRSRSRSLSFNANRYRQKENRRPDRREDFIRNEFRDRSPQGNYPPRSGRSRGRVPSPSSSQFFRQDRQLGGVHSSEQHYFHNQMQSQNSSGGSGGYNDLQLPYLQNNNRYSRENQGPPLPHPPQRRGEQYGRNDRNDYPNRFDDGPPGTDEPPPPGFENSPQQRERHNSWNHNQFEERSYKDDYRKLDGNNKKDYGDRQQTPDMMRDKESLGHEDRRRHDGRNHEERSWSRTSHHSSINVHNTFLNKRNRSRSKSPIRLDRGQDIYSGGRGDHHPGNKDRYRERFTNSRDRQIQSGAGNVIGHERDKIDHDKKRERDDRDRRTNEHTSRDRNPDRKGNERDPARNVNKDKDKERDKGDKEKDTDREKKRDSSEDEKKDKKKDKEKRKKKKEKEQEKKKKKERKEKEREKKEKEKEKLKDKDNLKNSEIDKKENEENEEFQQTYNDGEEKSTALYEMNEQNQMENRVLSDSMENVLENFLENDNKNENKDMMHITTTTTAPEEGELTEGENSNEQRKEKSADESEALDLYADICQDEEIRYDYTNTISKHGDDDRMKLLNEQKASPPEFKRFDSVLDIHANLDFEPELDDMEIGEIRKVESNVLVPLPELSKWERDDDNQKDEKNLSNIQGEINMIDDKTGRVTNEVIKRAENAIFARAINAIRPIEIKKISIERQKLYSNEMLSDISPVPSVFVKAPSPKNELPTFQITVPANSNTCERSVEIRSEKQKRSPIRSVKDRLGSKITEPPIQKRHRSPSMTPPRKVPIECRLEKVRGAPRSRSREMNCRRDDGGINRDREMRRNMNEMKRGNDMPNRNRGDRYQKDFKISDGFNRGYNRDQPQQQQQQHQQQQMQRGGGRDFDRRRDYGPDRRMWDQDKIRDKDKDRRRSPDKNRDNRNRERFPGRNNENDRVKDRIQTSNYGGNQEFRIGDRKGRNCSRQRSREPEKFKPQDPKRERSPSRSSDKSGKRIKRDKDINKKYSDDEKSPGRNKKRHPEKMNDTKVMGDDKTSQRKRIDELNFEPEQSDHIDESRNVNSNSNMTSNKTNYNTSSTSITAQNPIETKERKEKLPKDKNNPTELNKRSRTASNSSSSTSSSDTDSDSESDGNKKKKKRKHKKEKKRSRRSSSAESVNSTKHKRSKSKKKSKSSKKKKKSKK